MERWDIVTVLVALVGMFATILAPIVKLIRAITRLTTAVENIDARVIDLTSNNRTGHEQIWMHAREQDRQLCEHETRIRVLEEDRE